MTWGMIINAEGGIVQVDSDSPGRAYIPIRAGTGSGFYMDVKEYFEGASTNWLTLARRTPASGSWKSLFLAPAYDPPAYSDASSLGSVLPSSWIFNAAQGNSSTPTALNLTNDTISFPSFINVSLLSVGDEFYYQTDNSLSGDTTGSISAVGGLVNGNKYYIKQISGQTIKLSSTPSGNAINFTSYSKYNGANVANLVHSLVPSKAGLKFTGVTRSYAGQGVYPISYQQVSDVSYVVLQKIDYVDSSLAPSEEWGLTINNSNLDVAFDSRYYTLSSVPTIVGAVLPGISEGNAGSTGNIILRTDYSEYPDHSQRPASFAGGNTREHFGFIFSNNSPEHGTGIKFASYVVNFFGTSKFPPNPGLGFFEVKTL